MSREVRARDVQKGQRVRSPLDPDHRFDEVVSVKVRGEDVLIDVAVPQGVDSLPAMDGDDVLEVQ